MNERTTVQLDIPHSAEERVRRQEEWNRQKASEAMQERLQREIDRLRSELAVTNALMKELAQGRLEAAADTAARHMAELATKDARIAELEEQRKVHARVVGVIERIAADQSADPAEDDLTIPLALELVEVEDSRSDNKALRKELAEAKAALATWDTPDRMGLVELAKAIKVRVGELEDIDEQNKAAMEAANARIAELEAHYADLCADLQKWKNSTERAEARIAELEKAIDAEDAIQHETAAHWHIERARAERAEAECKALREAMDALRERQKLFEDGNRPVAYHRDTLGRYVREAWIRWAHTQPSPKPSWLVNYDELPEPDKEADRQIGECIARWTLIGDAARAALNPSPGTEEQ